MRVPIVCPKCQRERKPGEDACARCGLLVTRWEGFTPELPRLEPVDRAWEELVREWHDDAAHRRFLEKAAAFDGLDVAAALYRQRKREHPDDARADEALRRTVLLAQDVYAGRSHAARTRAPSPLLRVLGLAGALVIVLCGLWTVFLLMTSR